MLLTRPTRSSLWRIRTATAGLFVGLAGSPLSAAAILGSGDWSDSTKWSGGVPNSAGAVAEALAATSPGSGTVNTAVDGSLASLTLGQLISGTQTSWNIDLAVGGPTFITVDNGGGTAVLGRTGNNGGGGGIFIDHDLVLNDNLSIRNVSASSLQTTTAVRVGEAGRSITGTANLEIRQGSTTNNGANAGRQIRILSNVNHTGAVTINNGYGAGVSNLAQTGDIRLLGGIGASVTGIAIDAGNRSTVAFEQIWVFTLGNTPDTFTFASSATAGIGGVLDISGLTLDFAGSTATLPSYLLLDYTGSDLSRLVLDAGETATNGTFGGVLNLPSGYSIVHDTVNQKVLLIPEPGALALLGLGGLMLLPRKRRA